MTLEENKVKCYACENTFDKKEVVPHDIENSSGYVIRTHPKCPKCGMLDSVKQF